MPASTKYSLRLPQTAEKEWDVCAVSIRHGIDKAAHELRRLGSRTTHRAIHLDGELSALTCDTNVMQARHTGEQQIGAPIRWGTNMRRAHLVCEAVWFMQAK